jgi:sterol desaturase/sphingolipid hydroxylase (fatty acid hydroxylase superfamily)
MQDLLVFVEAMPTWQKAAWVFICLTLCWFLEAGFPLFRFDYRKWRHAGVNFVFLGTSMLINTLFSGATAGLFVWLDASGFGLLRWTDLSVWVELAISLLLFELIAQYTIHRIEHRVKWMWKFHMIHHSDTHLDATSGTRHHPGDYILRELAALIVILVTGVPAAFYFVYRLLTVFFTYITHANIRMPDTLDRVLSYVFVTPNMHKFHHHHRRPWTDTNFGNMFSVWDRLFGTFVYDDPAKIRYGLDVLDEKKDESVGYQMRIPFDSTIKTDY